MNLIYISLIILFIIIIHNILDKKCNQTLKYYVYDSLIPGPVITLIGGTHGNEPSGSYTIKLLLNEIKDKKIILKRGKLILIPVLNECAFKVGIRLIPLIGDMNRKYPKSIEDKSQNKIVNKIIQLTDESDIVIDFHEGWGFNKINKNSLGSTITPTETQTSMILAKKIITNLNKNITDNIKKFTILTNNIPDNNDGNYDYNESIDIRGGLRYYQNLRKKNYILVETTGQNNIQPIELRISQNKTIIETVFTYYNLI